MVWEMMLRLGTYLRLKDKLEWFRGFYERVRRLH